MDVVLADFAMISSIYCAFPGLLYANASLSDVSGMWGCASCPGTLTPGQGGFGDGQRDRGDGGCSSVTQQLVCGTLLMTGQVICAGGAVWAGDVRS